MPSEISFAKFGGPEVLVWTDDGEMPDPLPSQVVIVVAAASVSRLDEKIRGGVLTNVLSTFLPSGIGREAAGVVIARGSAVRDVEVGDAVLGLTDTGAYAQFAALTTYVRKPKNLSWAVACSLPMAAETATRVLRELDLPSGATLLVVGGAGNIGSMTAQLAIARGIRVIATVRHSDDTFIRSFGAVPVRYGIGFADRVRAAATASSATVPGAASGAVSGMVPVVNGALDTAGVGSIEDLVALTGSPDKVITIADPTAQFFGVRLSQPNEPNSSPHDRAVLARVTALVASGAVIVRVGRTYPIEQAARAHNDLTRRHKGRLVLVNGA